MKTKIHKNAMVTMDRHVITGMYTVTLHIGTQIADKARCDTYRQAGDYWKSFNKIAKTAL